MYTSWSYINIGEIQTIKGKYSEAEINLTEGLRIAQEIGSKAQIEIGYLKLSQLFSKTGKYKDALAAFEKSKTYRDSIINEKNNSTIAKLKTIYETEKKEKEILALTVEKQRKQRSVYILIGVLIIVAFAGVFFIFRARARAIIAEQNNRINEQKIKRNGKGA
ncbi:MAG: tetratricopeptide repeat protein, partial [Chloroflexia bacterium]|nr:tetratricopeptide repeat protein [Chloroflexia bacterium]